MHPVGKGPEVCVECGEEGGLVKERKVDQNVVIGANRYAVETKSTKERVEEHISKSREELRKQKEELEHFREEYRP